MNWKRLTQTWQYVEKWAEIKPSAEALVFQDERLTWGDVKNRLDMIAKAFIEIGVEKGDRVAMLSAARNEFLTTFLASGKIGAVWLGLSPKATLDELGYLIGDSQPTVLITVREYLGTDLTLTVKKLMEEFPCLKKVLVIGDPLEGTVNLDAFAYQPRRELDSGPGKAVLGGRRPRPDSVALYLRLHRKTQRGGPYPRQYRGKYQGRS